MNNPRSNGFTHLILLIVIFALGLATFLVWNHYHYRLRSGGRPMMPGTSVNNFETCKNSPGSKMIETYPEQCVTKNGKSYPNPDQVGQQPDIRQ